MRYKYKQKMLSRVRLGVVTATILILGIAGVTFAKFGGAGLVNGSSSIDLQKGLVGWWTFDGTIADSSSSARASSLTYNNQAVYIPDRNGAPNQALQFNGANEGLYTSAVNLFPNPDFTITFWTNNTSITNEGYFGDSDAGANSPMPSIFYGSPGSAIFQLYDTSGQQYQWSLGNFDTTVNQWWMITIIKSGSTINVYRNGTLFGSYGGAPSGTVNVPSTSNFAIGSVFGGWYSGSMDDFRVYNRAVSAAEVSALYNSDHPTNISRGEQGLVGRWKLDGNALDNTVYANNGTVSNVALTNDYRGRNDAAYAFDGTSSYIKVPYANITRPTSAITLSAWIKISDNASTTEERIISTTESGGYALFLTGSSGDQCIAQQVCFMVNALNNYQKVQASKSLVPNNTWTHLVGSYDPSTGAFALYINGNLVGTNNVGQAALTYTVNTPLCIGAEATTADCSGGMFFSGSIGDVRIYNRVLGATEVQNMYSEYNPQINLNTNAPSSGIGNIYKGLVGSWNFNGNAMDDTVYSDNATENGAVLTADRKGRANSAYSFDGTKHMTIPDSSILDSTTGTWAIWVKTSAPTSGGNSYVVMSKTSSASSNSGITLTLDPNNGMKGGLQMKNASSASECESAGGLNDGTWHHLAVTFDGDVTATLYVDGVSECTIIPPAGWSFYASSPLMIGSSSDGWWQPFNGSLDNVRVYNRALSAAEVQTLYQQYQ